MPVVRVLFHEIFFRGEYICKYLISGDIKFVCVCMAGCCGQKTLKAIVERTTNLLTFSAIKCELLSPTKFKSLSGVQESAFLTAD